MTNEKERPSFVKVIDCIVGVMLLISAPQMITWIVKLGVAAFG